MIVQTAKSTSHLIFPDQIWATFWPEWTIHKAAVQLSLAVFFIQIFKEVTKNESRSCFHSLQALMSFVAIPLCQLLVESVLLKPMDCAHLLVNPTIRDERESNHDHLQTSTE